MNNKKRYDGGGEIQAKIDKFTKLMNDSRSTEDEISRYKLGIEKLKAMLPSGAEKPAEKVAEKKTAEKKPAEKKSTEKKPSVEEGNVKQIKLVDSKIFVLPKKDTDELHELTGSERENNYYPKLIKILISEINKYLKEQNIPIITTKKEFDLDDEERVYVDNNTTIRLWDYKSNGKKGHEFRVSVFREEKESKVAEKKTTESSKKKGVQVLSSKRVMVNGEEVGMDSKEFCDYLLGEFRKRREKAEENKTKKKKTTSVMSKVTSNIEKGITTAIKNSIKDNRVAINKNPKVFIGKVQKLETATKNFLDNLKEVLGSEFDAKEVTSTTNAIHSMIEELKKKYADKK